MSPICAKDAMDIRCDVFSRLSMTAGVEIRHRGVFQRYLLSSVSAARTAFARLCSMRVSASGRAKFGGRGYNPEMQRYRPRNLIAD